MECLKWWLVKNLSSENAIGLPGICCSCGSACAALHKFKLASHETPSGPKSTFGLTLGRLATQCPKHKPASTSAAGGHWGLRVRQSEDLPGEGGSGEGVRAVRLIAIKLRAASAGITCARSSFYVNFFHSSCNQAAQARLFSQIE